MMTLQTLHFRRGALHPKQPFSFAQTLHFIRAFTPAKGEQVARDGELTKAVMIDGKPLVFRVAEKEEDGGQNAALHYILFSEENISREVEVAAVDRIRFYLSLDDDLGPFYKAAEGDPAMEPVISQLYGLHQVKFLTPFENACWAVLTQRMAIPAARSMKQRLIERYGGNLEVDGATYWAFPEVGRLSAAPQEELEATIGHAQKAGYIYNVAQAFNRVDEAWLRTGDYEEVAGWLRGIKGIGEWSAYFVLVRGLGRMEDIAPTEKRLLAAATRAYGRPLIPDALGEIVGKYGTSQGYWAFYMRNWV